MKSNHPHKKFLISERALNYILRPVQVNNRNYPYSYVIENLDQDVTVTVDGPWIYSNHLILDFIGHEMYERVYQHVLQNKESWKNHTSLGYLQSVDALKEHQYADLTPELEPYAHYFEEYIQILIKEKELSNKGELSDEYNCLKEKFAQLRPKIEGRLRTKFDEILKIRSNGWLYNRIVINLKKFLIAMMHIFQKNAESNI